MFPNVRPMRRIISNTSLGRALAGTSALALVLALAGNASFAGGPKVTTPTLTGFAALPAATFVPGSEPSGSLVTGNTNGYRTPFVVRQHVERAVTVVRDAGETLDRLVGFDVESIVKAADGTYWIGDEFGPYLLHFDRAGRLLAAPIPLDGVVAPETAARTGVVATLGSSKGFEGLAASPDGRYLYPLLEGTVTGDPAGHLRLNEFDLRTGAYTSKRYTYPLDAPNLAIGDAIAIDKHRFLVIERDNGQDVGAVIKRLYVADTRDRNRDGLLDKTLLVDLMNVANPKRLGGFGTTFTFPFQTIENVVILDERTVAVLNDNNFPFSTGRTPGVAEDNEWITIKLPRSLDPDKRVLR